MASQRPPSPDAALDADHTDARRHLRLSSLAASHHPVWLTPLLAGATVARDRAALLSVSTHDRSIWPPSPGYTAATASLSHCPWSTKAEPEKTVCWHAADKSCGKFETRQHDVQSCPRPCRE